MNIRVLLFVLLAALSAKHLVAQSALSELKKPVLPRAPALASWTISYKYAGENAKPAPASGLAGSPRTNLVTKTNKIYWEQVTLVSGEKYEKWILDGTQLKTLPSSSTILLVPPPSVDATVRDYSDYQKFDFAELSWVSQHNYKGLGSYAGISGYRFEENGKTAILSAETQLPLYFSDGEAERFYTYNPPPGSPLVVPRKFLDVIQTQKRGVESLKYHPIPM